MPHQCTTCGHTFPDGSKEMLSGCPDCGGNKFQFHKGGIPEDATLDGEPSGGTAERSHVANAVGKAAGTLRDFVAEKARPSPSSGTPEVGAPSNRTDSDAAAAESTRSGADEAGAAETTQATLDSLAADETSETGHENAAPATPSTGTDSESSDDVAARWPSVGTEAGVETGAPDTESDTHEWPDPWESEDGEPDDTIVAEGDDTIVAEPDPEFVEAGASDDESIDAGRDAQTVEAGTADEDRAQAAARASMVGADELPDGPDAGRVVREPTGERPDLAELREELNDQFESIRVVAPGQYELNLMELYDREEYIIAIQENGKYVIDVPDKPDAPLDASE